MELLVLIVVLILLRGQKAMPVPTAVSIASDHAEIIDGGAAVVTVPESPSGNPWGAGSQKGFGGGFVPTVGNPAPNVNDSVVNGVDVFLASGGIAPTAGGGDTLLMSFVGTDGITQYTYERPNGDTYTTTVKNV